MESPIDRLEESVRRHEVKRKLKGLTREQRERIRRAGIRAVKVTLDLLGVNSFRSKR